MVGTLWVVQIHEIQESTLTPGGALQENASLSLGQLTQPGTE